MKVLDSKMIVMMDANSEESEKRGKIREAQFSFDYAYGQVILVLDRRQRQKTSTTKHSPAFLTESFKATTRPFSPMELQDAARHTRPFIFTQNDWLARKRRNFGVGDDRPIRKSERVKKNEECGHKNLLY